MTFLSAAAALRLCASARDLCAAGQPALVRSEQSQFNRAAQYEAVLAHEIAARKHNVERQVPIAIRYDDLVFDVGFRADLLVDGLVIVELKSVEDVLPAPKKQVLTY